MKRLPQLIGVIHLPPLVGAPMAEEEDPAWILDQAGLRAVQEAEILERAGFDGIIIENFGDIPFFKTRVPPETVASMAVIAAAVRESVKIPLGINVLRNDGHAALAIAAVTGCDFVRVNVLSGVTATDQGIIEGEASFLFRERARLRSSVVVLADAHVKHGVSLSSLDIRLAIEELGDRALVDGVILTGKTTGRLVDLGQLEIASQCAREHQIPLYLGSGVGREQIHQLKSKVDGIIVGSALRKKGKAGEPLDLKRIKEFVKEFKKKPIRGKQKSRK